MVAPSAGEFFCGLTVAAFVNAAQKMALSQARPASTTCAPAYKNGPNGGDEVNVLLPGKNYGTPQDEQVLLATHTDAMSLIEENGGLGMLGIMSYFNHLPRSARPTKLRLSQTARR